jgi:hypothetical protein
MQKHFTEKKLRRLRKCDSERQFEYMASYFYKEIDKSRPGRNYNERFMLEEAGRTKPIR